MSQSNSYLRLKDFILKPETFADIIELFTHYERENNPENQLLFRCPRFKSGPEFKGFDNSSLYTAINFIVSQNKKAAYNEGANDLRAKFKALLNV